MKKKVLSSLLAAGLAAVLLAGCGSAAAPAESEAPAEEAAEEAEAEPEEEAEVEEAEAETTEETEAEPAGDVRVVQVVAKSGAKPYQFFEDDGTFSGYNGDIFAILEERLGDKYKFEYNLVDANAVFVGLQSGNYDIAVGNYYTSAERNESYEHSNQMTFLSDLKLIVREDEENIKSLDDLAGSDYKLAQIDVSDPRYNIIESYNEEHPDKQVDLKGAGFETTADVLKSVADGRNDAAIFPQDGFDAVQREAALPLKTVDSVGLFPVAYYYYRTDENMVLRDDIDAVIAELRADGTLSELSLKWHGFDPFAEEGADEITEVDFWK